jgi:nucleotide-binding universal stress UspA family protein
MEAPRFVVAHDGCKAAHAALRWAARLVKATGGEVVAVHVIDPVVDVGPASVAEDARHGARRQLEEWVGDAALGVAVKCYAIEGRRPARELHRFTERLRAKALVIGAHRSEGALPWWGSTANELAHLSRVPLVVIPQDWARTLGLVVVGDDGSGSAGAAARWAASLVAATGATAEVVAVVASPVEWVPRHDPASWIHAAQGALTRRTDEVFGPDAVRRVEVLADTNPVAGLLDAADRFDADLVVVGARGAGGFGGLRMGGTALQLLHHTTRPLAIVPSGW